MTVPEGLGSRVLLVDDSRAIRAVLRRMLHEAGFSVYEAGNGHEALRVLDQEGVPDIALLDWNMPEMNGYELLLAIRARPDCDGLPVLMVTTESEAEQVMKALDAGADEYLMKPFTNEALLAKVQLATARMFERTGRCDA
jgi:two-component system chemotaxis response regulator CheY